MNYINILGQDYKITGNTEESVHGFTNISDLEIGLSPEDPPQERLITLIHEVIETIAYHLGLTHWNRDNESIIVMRHKDIDNIARHLIQLFDKTERLIDVTRESDSNQ